MKEKIKSLEWLLTATTPKELSQSLDLSFNELLVSDHFAELPKQDREYLAFHCGVVRDFSTAFELQTTTR